MVGGGFAKDSPYYWPQAFAVTAREHRSLRKALSAHFTHGALAIEFGCGWARNLPVLQEYCENVLGFERDEEFAQIANCIGYKVTQIETLYQVPAADHSADLILTYACLQHIPAPECQKVCAEIKRVAKNLIVFCEITGKDTCKEVFSHTPDMYSEWLGMQPIAVYTRPPQRNFDTGREMIWRI